MLIIIPAYNEELHVGQVVAECCEHGPVAVIDDGSTDCTAAAAHLEGAMVITQGCNRGYSSALKVGYAYAIGAGHDCVVQLDADGQHMPRYITRLSIPVIFEDFDIVIGSRFYYQYRADFCKSVGILFFRKIVEMLTGLSITDTTSGFQCLSRRAMEFYLHNRFVYPDANAVIAAHRAGLKIREVPVMMRQNTHRPGMHRGVRHLARYMWIVLGDIRTQVLK